MTKKPPYNKTSSLSSPIPLLLEGVPEGRGSIRGKSLVEHESSTSNIAPKIGNISIPAGYRGTKNGAVSKYETGVSKKLTDFPPTF